MSRTSYLPHIIYSVALTSVSIHLLWQRKTAEAQKASVLAQTSILEDIAQRLRSNDDLSDEEYTRLRNLARKKGEAVFNPAEVKNEEIGWKDVFLGKKIEEEQATKIAELERLEWEKLRAEFKDLDSQP
ncbi:hypothetical protein GLOTRDRAFT_76550 [Gloeophyllum trabeum ATCC 11539]|uniref:Uncharacterized protein n=1 Tax=Gloeophyllum trabeum (strain ATCC 11539 / FP-39264 / Madison 617) TaxID=670483 RepID=S7Q6S5_GLOTA|nr:uncharacterized protein GLOTRDRAFT_76550 [Gloeophyllum trabeum ATCC 11539]EPQ55232.1 hypothetical protein GLOTRDRAFT_76550 [Gloeophyllum trabeum ATCC 11539]